MSILTHLHPATVHFPIALLLLGSLLALTTAVAGALAARRLEAGAVPRIAWDGARQVADALLVLYLAWALSNAMGDTGASKALTGLIDGTLPAWQPRELAIDRPLGRTSERARP